MSELGDLESAVVALIAGIESGGSAVFQSVSGFSGADRKAAVAALGERTAPFALVGYGGRLRGDDAIVGLPRLSVWISARNLRGGDDVRIGDGAALGGFDLLGLVMGALDGTVVESDRRLAAIDEQVIASDETQVIYEQRYVVDRVSELTQPTFDGVALAGAESLVQVVVGEVEAETSAFAFAGIDGEFRQHLGSRRRTIEWRGQLRAATDAALNSIESAIEAAITAAGAHPMVDSFGRTFEDCALVGLKRVGARRRHPVSGYAVQSFVMKLEQLNI